MPTQTNLISGVLWISHGDNGKQEIYRMGAATLAQAEADFTQLVFARSYLLAKDCQIDGWGLHLHTNPPRTLLLSATAIPSLKTLLGADYWLPVHDDFGGVRVGAETEPGEWANRIINFIADDEVSGGEWVRLGLVPPPGPPSLPVAAGAASKDQLWQYFLQCYRELTCHPHKLGNLAGADTSWDVIPWASVYANGFTTEKVGSNYVPVSWEADTFSLAPDFSPCGTIVWFLRRSYVARCRFYVNGSLNGIRWYVAWPTANPLPYLTVFTPLSQDLDYTNNTGIGELTGKANRTWSNGLSWSIAPGVVPTGTAPQFLGLTAATFNDSLPTPPALLPVCDMPGPGIRVDDDPGVVVVLNVNRVSFPVSEYNLEFVAAGWVKPHPKIPPKVDALIVRLARYRVDDLTYWDGAAFVSLPYTRTGDVITASANEALAFATIDPTGLFASPAIADRIFLDTGNVNGGIYTVTTVGDGSTPAVLTRASDVTGTLPGRIEIEVQTGAEWGHTRWILAPGSSLNVNSGALHFEQIGQYGNVALWFDEHSVGFTEALVNHYAVTNALVLNGSLFLQPANYYGLTVDTTISPGDGGMVLMSTTADNITVTLTYAYQFRIIALFNYGQHTIKVPLITKDAHTFSPTIFNLKPAQMIHVVYASTFFADDPFVLTQGWFLIDPVDGAAIAAQIAAALAAAPLNTLQQAQVMAMLP